MNHSAAATIKRPTIAVGARVVVCGPCALYKGTEGVVTKLDANDRIARVRVSDCDVAVPCECLSVLS